MDEDLNQKMDEMLRDYARERRKAPKVSLHPATRQMLQGEVARHFGTAAGAPARPHRFSGFWPRIAFVGGLGVVLMVAVISLRQPSRISTNETPSQRLLGEAQAVRSQEEKIERSEPAPSDVALSTPPQLEAEAREDQAVLLKEKDADLRDSDLSKLAITAPQTPSRQELQPREQKKLEAAVAQTPEIEATEPGPPQDLLRFYRSNTELMRRNLTNLAVRDSTPTSNEIAANAVSGVSTGTQSAGTPAPASAEALARASTWTNLGAAKRMQFAQSLDSGRTSVSAQSFPVLNNFQIEQLGDEIRFLDRDGSVYLGRLTLTTNPPLASASPALLAVSAQTFGNAKAQTTASLAALAENSAVYEFTAQGTNRMLGQDVLFSGHFFEKTNLAAGAEASFSFNNTDPRPGPRSRAPGAPNPVARRIVVGTATVAGTNQLPVHASSSEP